ncbi:MAG: hypothetical protein HFI40_16480 [Lachnospiraceae bacterium]|jgi:hypothetical protein|nr:hypothetical protein [Lachnospiraceae bacterium]
MKKNRNKKYFVLASIGIFLISGMILFLYPKRLKASQLWKIVESDLQQNGRNEMETPCFTLKLEPPFSYREGIGIFYKQIPNCFQICLLEIDNIFENNCLQTEILENELCHFLTRGYCEESFSPVVLSKGENNEVQAVYGVFSQAPYVMADFGELFGLSGEEENFDELIAHTIERDHVVLFYVPDTKIQYLFLANTLLISKEEILKLAEQISFNEESFLPNASERYLKNQERQEKERDENTKKIVKKIEEWKRFFRVSHRGSDKIKVFLQITLPEKRENLIPNGLLALQETRKRYILCLSDSWPVGFLNMPSGQIEWWLEWEDIDSFME